MTATLISTLTIALFITIANCQNYCDLSLCWNIYKHIACGNNGNFGAYCPKDVRMISTDTIKNIVVKMYNEKRNLIAGGKLSRYQPAVRMGTMQWDDELAKMAALNVKQCQMEHDQCHNTQTYTKSGQNVGMISFAGAESSRSDNELLRDRINGWWDEHANASMQFIKEYPTNYSGPIFGHFTVLVAEKNIACGCAAIRYTQFGWNHFLLACNYATTNIMGLPIYQSGTTASRCTTGKNPSYPNLCSVNEKYAGL